MAMRNLFGVILVSVTCLTVASSLAFATDTNVGGLPTELGCVATGKLAGKILFSCVDGRMVVRAPRPN